MLQIVLASLAYGFAANAVIHGLATGQIAAAGMPVACACMIASMLFDPAASLTLRPERDDQERVSFNLRLR